LGWTFYKHVVPTAWGNGVSWLKQNVAIHFVVDEAVKDLFQFRSL